MSKPFIFEKIKQQYGIYPKPMLVNLEVAKTIDRKERTSRICKLNDSEYINDVGLVMTNHYPFFRDASKWKRGDILWVREPVKLLRHAIDCDGEYFGTWVKYLADGKEILFDNFNESVQYKKWFQECQGVPNGCTKEMARTFFRVTNIRVEKLQDITYEDILKEGFMPSYRTMGEDEQNAYDWWFNLWDKTAPKGYKWRDNPSLFVYQLKRVKYE